MDSFSFDAEEVKGLVGIDGKSIKFAIGCKKKEALRNVPASLPLKERKELKMLLDRVVAHVSHHYLRKVN